MRSRDCVSILEIFQHEVYVNIVYGISALGISTGAVDTSFRKQIEIVMFVKSIIHTMHHHI